MLGECAYVLTLSGAHRAGRRTRSRLRARRRGIRVDALSPDGSSSVRGAASALASDLVLGGELGALSVDARDRRRGCRSSARGTSGLEVASSGPTGREGGTFSLFVSEKAREA